MHKIFIIVLTTSQPTADYCTYIHMKPSKKYNEHVKYSQSRLIDIPSLKEMHMHKINILLCFALSLLSSASLSRDVRSGSDVWKIRDVKHTNIIQFAILLSLDVSQQFYGARKMSMRRENENALNVFFPTQKPKHMWHECELSGSEENAENCIDVHVIFWGYVLLFSLPHTHTHLIAAGRI